MRVLLQIVAVAVVFSASTLAKRFEKCELARILQSRFSIDEVEILVCVAQDKTALNSGAFSLDGTSGLYGLFHIKDDFWCGNKGLNICGMECSALQDGNLDDDMNCVKTIINRHGISAWTDFNQKCLGANGSIDECNPPQVLPNPPRPRYTPQFVYPIFVRGPLYGHWYYG